MNFMLSPISCLSSCTLPGVSELLQQADGPLAGDQVAAVPPGGYSQALRDGVARGLVPVSTGPGPRTARATRARSSASALIPGHRHTLTAEATIHHAAAACRARLAMASRANGCDTTERGERTWQASSKPRWPSSRARPAARASHAVRLAQEAADIIAIDLCGQVATVPYPMATPGDLAETVEEVEALDLRIVAAQDPQASSV